MFDLDGVLQIRRFSHLANIGRRSDLVGVRRGWGVGIPLSTLVWIAPELIASRNAEIALRPR